MEYQAEHSSPSLSPSPSDYYPNYYSSFPPQSQSQPQGPLSSSVPNHDGWILYYSPEGYPYYYNEYTGESQWAEYEEEVAQNQDPDEELDHNQYEDQDQEGGDDSDHSRTRKNYSDDESIGSEEYEEQEFQEYLNSDAGQRAYEEEKKRLEEYFNSKNLTEVKISDDEEEEDEYEETPGEISDDTEEDPQSQYLQQRQQYPQLYNENQRFNPYQSYPPDSTHSGPQSRSQPPMTPQQVSQFITTYGLPPPPNKYSPRRRSPGSESALGGYNPPGSGMATPRGMRIGRRQESIGPDIEGGDTDEIMNSSPGRNQIRTEVSTPRNTKKKKRVQFPEGNDPDLQIIKEPMIPPWLSLVAGEMYQRLFRYPLLSVVQILIATSQSSSLNPVNGNTIDDPLQLSDIIPSLPVDHFQSPQRSRSPTSPTVVSLSDSVWDYLNSAARYLVEGKLSTSNQTLSPSRKGLDQQQEPLPP